MKDDDRLQIHRSVAQPEQCGSLFRRAGLPGNPENLIGREFTFFFSLHPKGFTSTVESLKINKRCHIILEFNRDIVPVQLFHRQNHPMLLTFPYLLLKYKKQKGYEPHWILPVEGRSGRIKDYKGFIYLDEARSTVLPELELAAA